MSPRRGGPDPAKPRLPRQAWLESTRLRSVAGGAEAAKIVRALEQKRGCFLEEHPLSVTVKSVAG
ncbi:MAG: hypothetical protein ACYC23_19550 [Limisphaerales bacterium]